jgi:SAM-dependent methyltransferase
MKECSKSIPRRLSQPNFINKYFVGHGLDIGGKPDPLALYREVFSRMQSVRTWDLEDGDAQDLTGVEDASFDFVHSSHCLEHLRDPLEALRNWLRVVKPAGYVIFTVPDEDLYEQGQFPSTFNRDHKWTFTVHKIASWSPKSVNVVSLVSALSDVAEPVKVELLDATFRRELPRYDQTLSPIGECSIEVILRRRTGIEIAERGRLPHAHDVPEETRIHLNQYLDDIKTLKKANAGNPPFENTKPI